MSLIDLSLPRALARGILSKIITKRESDAASDLLYEVDVVFPVDSAVQADLDQLDVAIPGASAMVLACARNQKHKAVCRRSGEGGDVFLTVDDPTPKAANVMSLKTAQITQVTAKAAGPLASLTIRFRLRGLKPLGEGARLTDLLERDIDLVVDVAQQQLPLGPAGGGGAGKPIPRAVGWDGSIGSVVSGVYRMPGGEKRPFSGIVISANELGDELEVEDGPAGDGRTLAVKEITATVHVGPDVATVALQLNAYRTVAESKGVPASWSTLLRALGQAHADGSLQCGPNGEWALTDAVIADAIRLSESVGEA